LIQAFGSRGLLNGLVDFVLELGDALEEALSDGSVDVIQVLRLIFLKIHAHKFEELLLHIDGEEGAVHKLWEAEKQKDLVAFWLVLSLLFTLIQRLIQLRLITIAFSQECPIQDVFYKLAVDELLLGR